MSGALPDHGGAPAPQCWYVDDPNGEFHCRAYGSSGPLLVLLHDSPGSSLAVEYLAHELTRTFQVLTVDLPGHGATTVAWPAGGLAAASALTAAALSRAGVRNAPVVGAGLGAEVASVLHAVAPDVCAEAIVLRVDASGDPRRDNDPDVGGTDLMNAWWQAKRAAMFRPWYSMSRGARIGLQAPPPAVLHERAVDQLAHVNSPIPRWQWTAGDAGTELSQWNAVAIEHAVKARGGTLSPSQARGAEVAGAARCRYQATSRGRVHLRRSRRPSDALHPRTVVVLPPAPGSSTAVAGLVGALGRSHDAIAIDYPGHGRSDPISPTGLEDYVDAVEEVTRALGLAKVDVLGIHSGALLAVIWQQRYPARIRTMALLGVPLRSAFCAYDLDAYLPDLTPVASGAHIAQAWTFANDRELWAPWYDTTTTHAIPPKESTPQAITEWAVDLLRGAATYSRLYRLVMEYSLETADLRPVDVPVLLLDHGGDALSRSLAEVRRLLPAAVLVHCHGYADVDAAERTAELVTTFFNQADKDAHQP